MDASTDDQESLHTVPHTPFTHTSTLPSKECAPPSSLTAPCVQTVKETLLYNALSGINVSHHVFEIKGCIDKYHIA